MPRPPITTFSSLAVKESPTNNNNGFYAPQLTAAQIAAIPVDTLVNGAIMYNTTTNQLQTQVNGATQNIPIGGAGLGDVVGPVGAVDDNIATFDGVTGKLIKDSGVAINRVPAPLPFRQFSRSLLAPNVLINEISNLGHVNFINGLGIIFVDGLTPVEFITNDFGLDSQVCSLFTGGLPSSSTTPSALVELQSNTGALLLSRLTTLESNDLFAALGMLLFDTDLNSFRGYNGADWLSFPLFNTNGTLTVTTPIDPTDAANKDYVDTRSITLSGAVTGTGALGSTIVTTLTNINTSQITNFNAAVTAFRLDQFAIPITSINLNSQKIINLLNPTLPQDASTKSYVDTTVTASLTNLNSKTQNISLLETTPTSTKMTQNLILGAENTIKSATLSVVATSAIATSNINFGWSFTPTVNITVTKYKIQTAFWASANATKPIAIFNNATQALVGVIQTLDKLTIENGYYIKLLATPLVLTAGVTYVISGLLQNGDFYTGNTNTYPAEITPGTTRYTNGPDSTAVYPTLNVGVMTGAVVSFDYTVLGGFKNLQCNSIEVNGNINLIGLTTGLLKKTVSLGVGALSTAIAGTDYYALNFPTRILDNGFIAGSSSSFFIGTNAGNLTTTAINNTGVGYGCLNGLTTGTSNTAIGHQSSFFLTTGSSNVAIGKDSLTFTTIGAQNTVVGVSAYAQNTIGSNNTGVGWIVGGVSGSNNTALGSQAGRSLTTYNNCVFVGSLADALTDNLTNAIAIGYFAQVNASNCMVLGGSGANQISVGIGLTPNCQFQLPTIHANRKIVLYETANNDYQFLGFGTTSSEFRFHINQASTDYVFYRGNSALGASELMRLTGNGNLLVGASSALAKIVATNGVQNISGEDSCIRAVSFLNSAKIELQCNNNLGRLWELRSNNNGSFDITDRTGSSTRLTIDSSGTTYAKQSYASYYATGSGTTIIPNIAVFIKTTWPSTSVQTQLNNFTYATSRFTYTGATNSNVSINVSLSATQNAGNGELSTFAIYRNGIRIASINTVLLSAGISTGNATLNVIAPLIISGDFFELWVSHDTTAGRTITITSLNFTISST